MKNIISLDGLLKFQIQRKFINFTKDALILLEEKHNHIQKLERLLLEMGLTEYSQTQFDYKKDRGIMLGKCNDSIRELETQIDLFEFSLKK